MRREFLGIGAVLGATAVAMAAVAAHALGGLPPDRLRAVDSAVQMLGWHAVALVLVGLGGERLGRPGAAAGWSFVVGTTLFCGAIAAHALTGRSLGPVAPTGGLLLVVGWLALAVAAFVPTPRRGRGRGRNRGEKPPPKRGPAAL